MKKYISLILCLLLVFNFSTIVFADTATNNEAENKNESFVNGTDLGLEVKSAYLCEATTGTVLYAINENERSSPASVTKIMTLLLVCEALDEGRFALTDTVTVSGYAASMGGSQVFLEEGERLTVEDLIKCTVIASANDAAVALAELVAGSESAFVHKMNEKARLLGLTDTSFENTTGLDDTTTNHYSSALDIAKMSCELIKHDIILKYSSIWQDTIRNGEFTLTNTNRLVRYYDGCNGLKTGSTDKAGYCVSTTAKRGNLQLVAVVMGAESRDKRNSAAKAMLDYGFASFALFEEPETFLEEVPIKSGRESSVRVYSKGASMLVDKSKVSSIEKIYNIPESLSAPIRAGDTVGSITYMLDGEEIGKSDIYCEKDIEKIGVFELFVRILRSITCGL